MSLTSSADPFEGAHLVGARYKSEDDYVAALLAGGGFTVLQTNVSAAPALRETVTARRQVRAVQIHGLKPRKPDTAPPIFRMVDPKTLLVDDSYQRSLSEKSTRLIRKVVEQFDWRRFKPPVVAKTADGLEVIDGQHTAIAAASHPEIAEIPVMIVSMADRQARAQAFIGHNRDRLGITPMQLHHSAVVAGDEQARMIDQVCAEAGVAILKMTPGNGAWKARQTVAVAAIGALVTRRGGKRAVEVLKVLAQADLTPIQAGHIKAVDRLMHEEEYAADLVAEDITAAIVALGDKADQEAAVFAATHRVAQWQALAVVIFRKCKKRGRARAH